MTKELLIIEFRYNDKPINKDFSGYKEKKITIGIYDTIEEAVNKGNKVLEILSKYFEVRPDDRFEIKWLFGSPRRLVTNTCYPTKGIEYFAQIVKLKYDDLEVTIKETFEAFNRYEEYKLNEKKEE